MRTAHPTNSSVRSGTPVELAARHATDPAEQAEMRPDQVARRRRPRKILSCARRLVVLVSVLTVSLAALVTPPALAQQSAPASTSTTQPTTSSSTITTSTTAPVVTTTTIPATTTTSAPPATTSITSVPAPTTTSTTSTSVTTTTAPATTSTTAVTIGPTPLSVGAPTPASSPPAIQGLAPSATPSSTGTGGSVAPGESATTGNFSRVLKLLENSAGGPGPRDDSLTRAEQEVTRLQAELAAAQQQVGAADAALELTKAAVTANEVAMRAVDDALATLPLPPAPAPKVHATPTLTSIAPQRPKAAEAVANARARTLAQRVSLDAHRERTLQALDQAGQRAAAAREAHAAKSVEVETAVRALEALRRQLWSKLDDPIFTSVARVLVSGADGRQVEPSRLALSTIPSASLELYRRVAATCPGLSWTVLAAIGSIESDHGRSTAPGVREGANFAGAMGPMQFMPETWAAYGMDGDSDGKRDVYNPADAVHGSANYLCASGAGALARLAEAIWAYNHAGWYVDDVLALALRYGAEGVGTGPGTPSADAATLLNQPNLVLTAEARSDLTAGLVDPRLVRMLATLSADHRIAVSVIKTGHSKFVAGTDRVSNHYYGRGVDIYAVDGADVTSSNHAALRLSVAILTSAPDIRPDEFGSPWPELGTFPGAFSDAGHQGHLHLGWRAVGAP